MHISRFPEVLKGIFLWRSRVNEAFKSGSVWNLSFHRYRMVKMSAARCCTSCFAFLRVIAQVGERSSQLCRSVRKIKLQLNLR